MEHRLNTANLKKTTEAKPSQLISRRVCCPRDCISSRVLKDKLWVDNERPFNVLLKGQALGPFLYLQAEVGLPFNSYWYKTESNAEGGGGGIYI